jgi:hypothetical protein
MSVILVIISCVSCMYVSILSLSFHVKFICDLFRKRALSEVRAQPVGGWGCYKLVSEKKYVYSVTLPDLLVAGDVTKWYQSIFWSSMARPGWSGMLKIGIRAMVSTLSLDGPC